MKTLDEYRTHVFEVIKTIPKGKVMSYKQVAEKVGIENPRLVGRILNTNTNPKEYPCHRVIRSDGTVASGYAFGGPDKQIAMLESEGIAFSNKKIANTKYFYHD
jgi:methylated-DNA-protein-cysteine methyltransferase-like protein